MSSLQISQGTFRLSDTKTLHLDSLTLNAGDSWAFVGANGSGKSALARALAGELPLLTGERQCRFTRITRLSFEQLQKLVSDEWQRNNTDMLSLAKTIPDALPRKLFRMMFTILPAVRCWRSSSAFPLYSTGVLNTFLPARREKRCCVRR